MTAYRIIVVLIVAFMLISQVRAQRVTFEVNDTTGRADSLRALKNKIPTDIKSIQSVKPAVPTELSKDLSKASEKSVQEISGKSAAGIAEKKSAVQKTIFSEKKLREIEDSLRGMGIPKIPDDPSKISEDDLIDALNEKYPHAASPGAADQAMRDSIGGAGKMPALPGMPANVTELSDLSDVDLSQYKMNSDQLQNLAPLPGSVMKNKYLSKIDSMRKIRLNDEDLKLNEQKLTDHAKVTSFKEKPKFYDKTYLEGIVGVFGKDMIIYQVAPALGFHLTDYISVGMGPSLQFRKVDGDIKTAIGMRALGKVEFFKRQVYAQVEDSYMPSQKYAEKMNLNPHTVLVGGGFLLSLKSSVTLNLSLMYNLSERKIQNADAQPVAIRLGISTVKIEK